MRRPQRRVGPAVRVGLLKLHCGTAPHLPENAATRTALEHADLALSLLDRQLPHRHVVAPTAEATGCVLPAAAERRRPTS